MQRGITVKICKNCGRQTEDDKIRCPYCGDLFGEDMDAVLRQMKSNLNSYKSEISAQIGSSVSASDASAPSTPPVQDGQRERFELLSEVAQLKGELKALHGEVERMHATQQEMRQSSYPQSGYTAQSGQTYAYGQPFGTQNSAKTSVLPNAQPVPHAAPVSKKKPRVKKRIVISVACVLLLALSIGTLFMPWVGGNGGNFKGLDSVLHLFGIGSGTSYSEYLNFIQTTDLFKGNEFIAGACRNVCYYGVLYGITAYVAFLALSLLQLCSLGGRISMKGWHRFTAWMSFLTALALFGIFCWMSGFSAVTTWFLFGAGANFVRCIFLAFYNVKKPEPAFYGYGGYVR